MNNTTKMNYFLFGAFIALIFAMFASTLLLSAVAFTLFIYLLIVLSLYFKNKKDAKESILKIKKTKEQKALTKIKKKRIKEAKRKHNTIHNQIAYIAEIWELNQGQKKSFINFIEKKAYSDLYSKMTASLLPQLIKMINKCIEQKKVGCKRDVNRRINELVFIMRDEVKRKKSEKVEDFKTLSEVYDHLIDEIK
jgi:Ca2+/Na+ antiporter